MEIILVRHGLSEANKANIFAASDTPLALEGHAQAASLAGRLSELEIEAIFTSTMLRAIDTAKPLADRLNTKTIKDARLDEVSFGSWEGKSGEDFEKTVGTPSWKNLDSYTYDFSQWNGEKYEEVEARVKDFLQDLKKKPYKLVLIVCHGGIVRCMHYLITGEKINWQPNAEELTLKT